jgi:hypothetical protein
MAAGLSALSLLSGCPGGQQGQDSTAAGQPQTKAAQGQPAAQPADKTAATPPTAQAGGATPAQAPPAPPPDEPNPRPTGSDWVFVSDLHHHIGEKLQVTCQLSKANQGQAMVYLVPENMAAQDQAASAAGAAASSPTVPGDSSTLNIDPPLTGRFRLRLFASKDAGAKLLFQSPVLTIDQWPVGDRDKQVPPYVTIHPVGVTKVEVQETFPVIAYFEVPAGYDPHAWVGVVPADTKSPLEFDNDKVQISSYYLQGQTKASFTWKPDRLGTFVFRLFPNQSPQCDYVAQSETFTVIPKGTPPAKK